MSDFILIIDDEQRIIDLAKLYLEKEGFTVRSANDGLIGYRQIMETQPALVILDLMLPSMDGLEICRKVRATSDVPIIMLTARSDDIDKIVGLELGADDYLTKPFNPRELLARVKAIMRRVNRDSTAPTEGAVTIGNVVIQPERRAVEIDGRTVDLRMKEFDLLLLLARNPSKVFTRERLLEVVWGYDFAGETRTVDVHVAHLRHKLEGMSSSIETVWGVGYKLEVR
jgi:DNA-binding response OmpR family regulator